MSFKIAAVFPGLLSPRRQSLFYLFFLIRKDFLENNPELGYGNYNVEFGVDLDIIKLKVLGFLRNIDLEFYLG
jgi:hypothetical protein